MKKIISQETIIKEALLLLNEVGIESVSTRKIAQRLGVEQPALYWHFKNKKELLKAMAYEAIKNHNASPLPLPGQEVKSWFIEHMQSFRKTLLLHRDGARLHSIMIPDHDLIHLDANIKFLSSTGIPHKKSRLILLILNKFTIGFVIEEQQEMNANLIQNDSEFYLLDKERVFKEAISCLMERMLFNKGVEHDFV
ncbi:TetR family transcriptional regulator [Pantoea stewartii]|uniref:TetR family transcriptional regulator n=1 Tax=Pantoea stewartii TaxID=66269 RepID=UPI0016290444|nr:TetR family transcriptional regulator [Pantoea stewartii]MBC0856522.1 TetR family transcriptional regulator [Pantoea stewartii]